MIQSVLCTAVDERKIILLQALSAYFCKDRGGDWFFGSVVIELINALDKIQRTMSSGTEASAQADRAFIEEALPVVYQIWHQCSYYDKDRNKAFRRLVEHGLDPRVVIEGAVRESEIAFEAIDIAVSCLDPPPSTLADLFPPTLHANLLVAAMKDAAHMHWEADGQWPDDEYFPFIGLSMLLEYGFPFTSAHYETAVFEAASVPAIEFMMKETKVPLPDRFESLEWIAALGPDKEASLDGELAQLSEERRSMFEERLRKSSCETLDMFKIRFARATDAWGSPGTVVSVEDLKKTIVQDYVKGQPPWYSE